MHRSIRALPLTACLSMGGLATAAAGEAADILKVAGPAPGIMVVVDPSDAGMLRELAADGRRVVHAVQRDPKVVEALRQGLGDLNGLVSVVPVADYRHLPYLDHFADTVVAGPAAGAGGEELSRITAPYGLTITVQGAAWRAAQKALPGGMDGWPHWDYSAAANAFSKDTALGLANGMRWMAGPSLSRSKMNVDIGYRADRGRLVTVERSEGPKYGGSGAPDGDTLVCRNAFNGALLWRRALPVGKWAFPNRSAVVMAGDRVITPIDIGKPAAVLDAATGETLVTLDQGIVLPMEPAKKDESWRASVDCHFIQRVVGDLVIQAGGDRAVGLDMATGRRVWDFASKDAKVVWMCSDGVRVVVVESLEGPRDLRGGVAFRLDRIRCLDVKTGKELWQSTAFADRASTRLIFAEGRLFVPHFAMVRQAEPEYQKRGGAVGSIGTSYLQYWKASALDPATGALLWTSSDEQKVSAHYQVGAVRDGVLYILGQNGAALSAKDGAWLPRLDFSPYDGCGEARGTPAWLFYNMSFTTYSPKGRVGSVNRPRGFARATCDTGVFPIYGSVLSTPAMCGCNDYPPGYNAFAEQAIPDASPDAQRLARGPAFGAGAVPAAWPAAGEWPIFLGGPARRSVTADPGPGPSAGLLWQTAAPQSLARGIIASDWSDDERSDGPVTPVTVAGGVLVYAEYSRNRVVALDAASGKPRWSAVLGGRIDSPPTLWGGLALVGCRDGTVQALRLSDGVLAWRFTAARAEQFIADDSHVESSWPVNGSVLIHKGSLYAGAGRHSSIDGGILLWRLDPLSGAIQGRTVIDTRPELMEPTNQTNYGGNRRGLDLLIGNGDFINHRSESIPWELNLANVPTDHKNAKPPLPEAREIWIKARQYFLNFRRASFGRYFTDGFTIAASGPVKREAFIGGDHMAVLDAAVVIGGLSISSNGQNFATAGLASFTRGADGLPERKPAWTVKAPISDAIAVSTAGGAIYLATADRQIRIFDLATGAERGAIAIPARVHQSGLAMAGGRIYASLVDGSIICLGTR